MTVDERHQDVEAGVQRAAVAAEPLDDVRALLRHDDRRLGDDDEDEQGEDHDDDQQADTVHQRAPSGSIKSSRLFDGHDPAALAAGEQPRCAVPRRPRRCRAARRDPTAPGAMSSSGTATSPTSESTSARRTIELQPAQQRVPEHEQRHDRQHGEEHQLQPERPCQVGELQRRDRDRRDAEEDDVEAAGRGHLQRHEDQSDREPVPPVDRH